LIVAHLVWTVLLTPAAFETRPFSTFTLIGWVSLGLIFTTVALDIAAFVMVGRRPRIAGSLAAIGPFLFVGPFIGDQAGFFSSLRPPTAISVLEVAAFLTQLTILWVALRVRRSASS
jgi:hypothetical protein